MSFLRGLISGLRRRLGVLRSVALVTYKEWGAYRSHSMVSILVGPVYFLVQYFVWKSVYAGRDQLRGMDFKAMLAYFGSNALISYLTMDFADWNLSMLVDSGKFLTFALRPVHHRFFALSQKCGHRVLGFFFEFVPCALIFGLLLRVPIWPARPLWALASVALAFLMNFYVNYSIGLSSFWLTRSEGLRAVYHLAQNLLSGALVPLVFFPKPLQMALFFLPFQYRSYVPAMVVSGHYSLGGIQLPIPAIVGIQALAVLAAALGSEILYRLALRRFNGVGA